MSLTLAKIPEDVVEQRAAVADMARSSGFAVLVTEHERLIAQMRDDALSTKTSWRRTEQLKGAIEVATEDLSPAAIAESLLKSLVPKAPPSSK